jgi:hypothetical protein
MRTNNKVLFYPSMSDSLRFRDGVKPILIEYGFTMSAIEPLKGWILSWFPGLDES